MRNRRRVKISWYDAERISLISWNCCWNVLTESFGTRESQQTLNVLLRVRNTPGNPSPGGKFILLSDRESGANGRRCNIVAYLGTGEVDIKLKYLANFSFLEFRWFAVSRLNWQDKRSRRSRACASLLNVVPMRDYCERIDNLQKRIVN